MTPILQAASVAVSVCERVRFEPPALDPATRDLRRLHNWYNGYSFQKEGPVVPCLLVVEIADIYDDFSFFNCFTVVVQATKTGRVTITPEPRLDRVKIWVRRSRPRCSGSDPSVGSGSGSVVGGLDSVGGSTMGLGSGASPVSPLSLYSTRKARALKPLGGAKQYIRALLLGNLLGKQGKQDKKQEMDRIEHSETYGFSYKFHNLL